LYLPTLFNPSAEPFEFFSRYWQSNMNNVKVNKTAHRESVRGLRWWLSDAPFLVCVHVQCVVCAETCPSNSFSRTDLKFCSCSDDRTVKVWDFARCQEEKSLTGNIANFFLQILILHTSHHLKLLCDITLFFLSNDLNFPSTQPGHGWDVKTVDWHPTKSLLVSG